MTYPSYEKKSSSLKIVEMMIDNRNKYFIKLYYNFSQDKN